MKSNLFLSLFIFLCILSCKNTPKEVVKEKEKTIVCGHFHSAWGHQVFEGKKNDFSPYYDEGIIAIDGCTSYTRMVNCIVIED